MAERKTMRSAVDPNNPPPLPYAIFEAGTSWIRPEEQH
jgi:hypothetical protein